MRFKTFTRRNLGRGCGVIMAAAAHTALADVQYSILDLGTLGGTRSEAYDINNSGRVVGFAKTAANLSQGFITAPSSAINPTTDAIGVLPGGTNSYAYGINASGVVAGYSQSSAGDRAFRYSGGTLTNLGTVAGAWSYGYGINNSGHVVAGSSTKNGASPPTHAALFTATKSYDLGSLAGVNADSWGQAINNGGAVTGYSNVDAGGYYVDHPFVWTPTAPNGTSGTTTDIGTLGGTYGYAWGINDGGQVVGGSYLANDLDYHAFKYSAGTKTDLGTLGSSFSEAYDVNLAGVAVGTSDAVPGTSHAFVYLNGTMNDLNSLIAPGSGWTLQNARGINDFGKIVGYGMSPSGQVHAFLLTPMLSESFWNVNAGGSWSGAANWLNGTPNGTGYNANFASNITAPSTVVVDQPVTVAGLNFNSNIAYTISGTNTITLANTLGNASVSVAAGSHLISAPLAMSSNTSVTVEISTSTLTISGNISSPTSAGLIKRGPGTLILSGNNDYAGPTNLNGGTLAVSASANLGAPNNALILQAGTLRTTAPMISTRTIVVSGTGATFDTGANNSTFGDLSAVSPFTKTGSGKLSVSRITSENLNVANGILQVRARAANAGTECVTHINGDLSIAPGATLDLNDNGLVVANGSFSQILNWVLAGYSSSPDSSKTGIISTTGQISNGLAILALFDNALFQSPDFPFGSGRTISSNAVVGKYTYIGDTNFDGQVTPQDYTAIDANLGATIPLGVSWFYGDTNFDGNITAHDYTGIDAALSNGEGNPLAAQGLAAVPEPIIGLLPALVLLRRRRRSPCVHHEPA